MKYKIVTKYDPLHEHLKELSAYGQEVWHASFADIETIIMAKLPPSAYRFDAWWVNQATDKRPQTRSWMNAGWETRRLNLLAKTVTFELVKKR